MPGIVFKKGTRVCLVNHDCGEKTGAWSGAYLHAHGLEQVLEIRDRRDVEVAAPESVGFFHVSLGILEIRLA